MGATFREATRADLPELVRMLADDPLGAAREGSADPLDEAYVAAFAEIERDSQNAVLVAEEGGRVTACLQLTITPSLTRLGATRATIEGVRVRAEARGAGIGRSLLEHALDRARRRGCRLAQLTTDMSRPEARRFYESLGFEATHVGMKLELEIAEQERR